MGKKTFYNFPLKFYAEFHPASGVKRESGEEKKILYIKVPCNGL